MNSKDAEPETPHWDFGRDVAQTVKLQIKLLLSYVDKTVKNKEEKRNRYLLPLKYLFCYAENSGLQDILKMDMAQEEEFTSLLRMQIAELNINSKSFIAFCRKTLFLEAEEINWEAYVWYVAKLNIAHERYSLSSTIESFSFLDIRLEDNRRVLQEYMKYLFTVTNKALLTFKEEMQNYLNGLREEEIAGSDLKKMLKTKSTELANSLSTENMKLSPCEIYLIEINGGAEKVMQ